MDLEEVKKALLVAADLADIAADWHLEEVQVHPPKNWGLLSYCENANKGWVASRELAVKFRAIVRELDQ